MHSRRRVPPRHWPEHWPVRFGVNRRPWAAAVCVGVIPAELPRGCCQAVCQHKITCHYTYPHASLHSNFGLFAPLRPPRSCSFASQRVMNPRTPRAVFRFAGLFRHHSRISRNCCITSTAGYTPAHSWHCSCDTGYSVPSLRGMETTGGDAVCGSPPTSSGFWILDSGLDYGRICFHLLAIDCN